MWEKSNNAKQKIRASRGNFYIFEFSSLRYRGYKIRSTIFKDRFFVQKISKLIEVQPITRIENLLSDY